MRMKTFFLSPTLILGLICVAAETNEGVVYYVLPTEPLSSCPENSSCPPGQLCHTMDYLAEHSSELFSPDHVNVTLVFLCGVHNYSKDLTVQNLHSFVMKGAESRENATIDHDQFGTKSGMLNCTIIQFFNVSFVKIKDLTMRCPAINIQGGVITVKSSTLYGNSDTEETLSFINIIGRGSQGLLDNCTFKENCFVTSDCSDGITVINSTFQSYRHQTNSIIVALSSVTKLTGNVNFTDSVAGIQPRSMGQFGTAVFLGTSTSTHSDSGFISSLNITTGAIVYFVNLTCKQYGGAVYGENGTVHIGAKARVIFMYNAAGWYGGAVYIWNGMITVGAGSCVTFMYNSARDGGAIWFGNGTVIVDSEANLTFSHNSVDISGGAIILTNGELIASANTVLNFSNNSAFYAGALMLNNSTAHVDTDGFQFYSNKGLKGGAMYFAHGSLYINANKSVMFVMNTAQIQGGAIFVISGVHPAIIVDNHSKLFLFNNSAFQGGALYIVPSLFMITVRYQSSIQLMNNTAFDVGGAVYSVSTQPCIFMITDYTARVSFKANRAQRGVGHHMYGASLRSSLCDGVHIHLADKRGKPHCWHNYDYPDGYVSIYFDPSLNETLSPVASNAWRVCLCDSDGKPQCANISYIFTNTSVYRGETIILPACTVGYDFGTTVGIIHASLLYSDPLSNLDKSQLVTNSEKCFPFNYTVYSKHDYELLLLQTSFLPVSAYVSSKSTKGDIFKYEDTIKGQIADYASHNQFGCINQALLSTPIFINITLLPGCPPGLTLNHIGTECSCYPALFDDFRCSIRHKTGILQWNSTVWVNATFNGSRSTGIIYNHFCPLYYCKSGDKTVNIGDDPSKQCASNRTGVLCGACMNNFSLAIGSSRCIDCPSSHNVALLLAFATAGVFLVFFILALNLTVTQGLINGVVYYANIVWAYKMILFPSHMGENYLVACLRVLVAWLNLDFGIETCFYVGLDAYWKTWLQFLFPFYIWAIAGVIIVACRYSSRLTNLIGSRAVPLLATLFLLSYMKLLHTAIDATSVAMITQYPQNTSYAVWYLDGNLRYCQHPHIYLFIAAIATLVFLWLPYTLLLLFIQPLRRVSHLRPFKWINKLAPVFDAHFSPLKDKHHYWFGALLLVRGSLLVLLTVTSVANPEMNVFVLFFFTAILLFFTSVKYVYKRMTVRFFESATLLNLIALSAGTLYKWESAESKTILLEVSIGITFTQFCVIVVLSFIKACLSASWIQRCRRYQSDDIINEDIDNDITHERIEDPELEPLIKYAPQPITMAASAKYTTAASNLCSIQN